MLEYTVISHYKFDEFEKQVNDMLKGGWDIQGGVSISIDGDGDMIFAQAFTQEKKEPTT